MNVIMKLAAECGWRGLPSAACGCTERSDRQNESLCLGASCFWSCSIVPAELQLCQTSGMKTAESKQSARAGQKLLSCLTLGMGKDWRGC